MAKYYPISEAEMTEFLAEMGFAKLNLPGVTELTYGKRVNQGNWPLSLRVYTGIAHGASRDVGEDAMRVVLVMRKQDGNIVKLAGSKRVHRVEGWRKNLKARIEGWTELMPKQVCPKCGMPLLPRKGRNGTFLGCAGFKWDEVKQQNIGCTFTQNIKG